MSKSFCTTVLGSSRWQAVGRIGDLAETEASGNVTLSSLRTIAGTGVTYVSVGALTHSVVALDISLNIQTQ